MRAHSHAHTLPNPEALGPEIEEGAVNRRPLQALFFLPQGGSLPAAVPGAISIRPTDYVRGVGLLRKLRPSAVAIGRLIGRGLATKKRRDDTIRRTYSPPSGVIPHSGSGSRDVYLERCSEFSNAVWRGCVPEYSRLELYQRSL